MIHMQKAEEILAAVRADGRSGFALRAFAMEQLSQLPSYQWSGIYRLDGDTLVLDAYVGASTDHVRIPVGQGVCGTAVAENRNQVVEDVRELTNYLSCSIHTRSEIVVLIRNGEKILGQIDIDGHEVRAFDASDEAFLSSLAELLAARWED